MLQVGGILCPISLNSILARQSVIDTIVGRSCQDKRIYRATEKTGIPINTKQRSSSDRGATSVRHCRRLDRESLSQVSTSLKIHSVDGSFVYGYSYHSAHHRHFFVVDSESFAVALFAQAPKTTTLI